MFATKISVRIPAMSVNRAYRMKKVRSDDYDRYERGLMMLLPKLPDFPKGARLRIDYAFGFRTDASDVDNPVKPLQDIVAKAYGFNDNSIAYITSRKYVVPARCEFLQVAVTQLPDDWPIRLSKEDIDELFGGKTVKIDN